VRRRSAIAALVLCTAMVAVGCGSGGKAGSPSTSSAPPTAGATGAPPSTGVAGGPDLAAVKVALARIGDLPQAIALAVRPADDALYVAQKSGQVRRVSHGQGGGSASVDPGTVLDLSGQVSKGAEQGLLGLTFSSDGARLYADYTDAAGDTQVVEYGYRDGRADTGSRRVVLTVDQPFANHNGGEVAFGPDGLLYVGLGDGGSEDDPNHVGQNVGTLLAKILRIDPAGPTQAGAPAAGAAARGYVVPPDNPFVGRAGAAPETFAWGLRNPWRFTWDRQTGDLWIGDVGQDTYEEIDFRPAGTAAGANFGWSGMEATHAFHGGNPPGGVLPITEYSHAGGNCSVTGGYVYRGSHIPALQGGYLYADYCSGRVWALTQSAAKVVDQRQLDVGGRHAVYSFGQDAAGELYLLASDGLFRIQPG
jgi:glucose/arabinose dehydrogenase